MNFILLWLGWVMPGEAGYNMAWFGSFIFFQARFGNAWLGLARLGKVIMLIWLEAVWRGMAKIRHGLAIHDYTVW